MTVPPADPGPDAVDAVAAAAAADPAGEPGSRGWLRRWRRITQPTPPDLNPGTTDDPSRTSLLDRSPLQIGFFGTIGAMAAVALVSTVGALGSILLLVLFSFALALGLNPAVSWFHNRGLRRGLAVVVVALVALILLGLAMWALVPVIIQQVQLLLTQTPVFLDNLRQNEQIAAFDAQFKVIDKAVEFVSSGAWISGLFGGLVGAGQAVATGTFSVIITIVLTLYFLITLPSIKDVIYQLAPASRRPRVRYLANEMFKRVGGYVSGLFTVMLIWMTVTFIFLNIIGIGEYAVALMVVVGLLALIPVVGTTVSTIILSIVAFAFSPTTGFITLGFFLVYQQVDAYFIAPRIFARSVQIPAVLVMLAAIAGGTLIGILGAILAIPITAALLLLYREVLVPHLDRK
ncbi:MAG: AI-2E family transporter [Actinobacteria bacterium HGW-Actinobacteria-2]|nr:MAG: AI-2E family transporter [Actinobacteria bacterium HGW-Actinobacteria-2]